MFERERRRVIVASSVVIVGMVAYWTTWFVARSLVASETTKAYYDFENAFPLADGWLTACLIGGIVALRRRSETALFWLLAAGSAGVYLFCMDALYDVEHGVWFKNGGGLIELLINIVTIAFSGWMLRWAWTRRALLSAADG